MAESSAGDAMISPPPSDWSAYLNARMLSTEATMTMNMILIKNSFGGINGRPRQRFRMRDFISKA